ncbi:MAG: VCBS repeat-containing protein, partial [Candidatus Thermoplasmatota archaeon]|nr:VCBS repeat-containing protein [Candidatus Thermoplasmatota archaeon]
MVKRKSLMAIFIICILMGVVVLYSWNRQTIDTLDSDSTDMIIFEKVSEINNSSFDVYHIKSSYGQSAYGVSSADFNGDGLLDFVVSYATSPFNYSTVSLFINKGNLTFKQQELFSLNYSYIKDLIAGDIDLVFSFDEYRWFDNLPYNMNGTLVLAWNNGNDDFLNLSLIHQWASEDYMDSNRRINVQITSADFDTDGDFDIVVGDNSGKVELLLNQGNGTFERIGLIQDFGWLSWGVASVDMNDDERVDLLVAAASNESEDMLQGFLYYMPNTGLSDCFQPENATVISSVSFGLGTGCLVTTDIEQDGIIDVIAGVDDRIFLFTKSNNTYVSRCLFEFSVTREGFFEDLSKGGMTVGDFNNDGYEDFITGGV